MKNRCSKRINYLYGMVCEEREAPRNKEILIIGKRFLCLTMVNLLWTKSLENRTREETLKWNIKELSFKGSSPYDRKERITGQD